MSPPIVLDFDGSVGTAHEALRIDLRAWHDRIRFACSLRALRALRKVLDATLPTLHGSVLLGSGDFHHVSLPLIERATRDHAEFDVVVLDNHPDNMRFAFGVHCGSWVRRVAALRHVHHVHVLGITSSDVDAAHAWQNYLRPLWRGKVSYACLRVDTRWARRLGLDVRTFDSTASLLAHWSESLARSDRPVYLSIDKDVFSPEVVQTNWDQGCLNAGDLWSVIDALRGRLIGCDITGEVSIAHYRSRLKRWLSALDGQAEPSAATLTGWQRRQDDFNAAILRRLGHLSTSPRGAGIV